MDITGRKVAILVDDFFEQAEYEEPIDALREAGAEVEVVATRSKVIHGMNHADPGDVFTADLILKDVSTDDYDALVLPGGALNADKLRVIEVAQMWVRDFLEEGKPVAIICHAPWILVSGNMADGRKLTSFSTIQDDMMNAGAEWVDQPVVIDESLITSRKPDDLPAFNEALIRMISRELPSETADAIEGSLKDNADPALDPDETEDIARLRALGYDKRMDGIEPSDEEDILAEEDENDSDELHLSSIVPRDEQDDTQ